MIALDGGYRISRTDSIDLLKAYDMAHEAILLMTNARRDSANKNILQIEQCLSRLDGNKKSYDHLKTHPNGPYLGYVVSQEDAKATTALFCLCVYDTTQNRVIWAWHTRFDRLGGFEAPYHPIEFTFHPQATMIAWAVEGTPAAICDFKQGDHPRFLDGEHCPSAPISHFPRTSILLEDFI